MFWLLSCTLGIFFLYSLMSLNRNKRRQKIRECIERRLAF
jgi:hypothetical protein